MSAHYDDPSFYYDKYWKSRDYEHSSEEIALRRLIGSRHFSAVADIGGGYGRLSKFLSPFSKKVVLIEPSQKQLGIAKKYLSGYSGLVSLQKGTAENTNLPDSSIELAVMIRVMHHLPDPMPAFKELYRIIKPDNYLILEVANSVHLKARLISLFSGKPILPTPIERRSTVNIRRQTIPFVNHHPRTVLRQLERAGFTPLRLLSVSNLRSPTLKRHFSLKTLSYLENFLQPLLSHILFGPSIFILAKKT